MQIEGPVQVARRSDMDMNGHINNVTYLGWALETVPADVYLNYSLLEVGRLPARCLRLLHVTPFHVDIAGCCKTLHVSIGECIHVQVEIDYKSECMAGQTVESLGSHIEEDTNGTGIRRFACTRALPDVALHVALPVSSRTEHCRPQGGLPLQVCAPAEEV